MINRKQTTIFDFIDIDEEKQIQHEEVLNLNKMFEMNRAYNRNIATHNVKSIDDIERFVNDLEKKAKLSDSVFHIEKLKSALGLVMMFLMIDIAEDEVSFNITLKKLYDTIKDDCLYVSAIREGFAFAKIAQKTSQNRDYSFLLSGVDLMDRAASFTVNDIILDTLESKNVLVKYFENDIKKRTRSLV